MASSGWRPLLKDIGGTSSNYPFSLARTFVRWDINRGILVVSAAFECPDPTQVFDALPYSGDGASIVYNVGRS